MSDTRKPADEGKSPLPAPEHDPEQERKQERKPGGQDPGFDGPSTGSEEAKHDGP